MASVDDYDFSTGDSGSSLTYPSEAGQIRKGGYIVIKGRAAKVIDVSTSKTGKHGHAKCNFVALDIFNNKKYEDIIPSTHTASVPNVSRKEYTLLDISDDDFCTLCDEGGETREDIKLPTYPEDMARKIKEAVDDGKSLMVTLLCAMGIEQITGYKEDTD